MLRLRDNELILTILSDLVGTAKYAISVTSIQSCDNIDCIIIDCAVSIRCQQ